MKRYGIQLAILLIIGLFFSSCNWRASWMLRTDKEYEFDVPPDTVATAFRISPNDFLTFRLFANDGFKLIDLTNSNINVATQNNNFFQFLVQPDGSVKLPIIGWTDLTGKTVQEAEIYLQERYSEFYNKPFVMLNVVNRRVVVFPGAGGNATVINLSNEGTTLIEGLAQAGGITNTGKARNVKLIRGDLKKDPQVYQFDLSTIEGVNDAGIVLQANDIIYVEPVLDVPQEVIRDISPIIGLAASVILALTAVGALN